MYALSRMEYAGFYQENTLIPVHPGSTRAPMHLAVALHPFG